MVIIQFLIQGRGVASRMKTIRISELDDDEAIHFLTLNKIEKEKAEKIVDFTGGLFKYLTLSVEENLRGSDLNEIKKEIEKKLYDDIQKCISTTSEDFVVKSVQTLLKSDNYSLTMNKFRDSVFGVGNDPNYEKFYQLIKWNVFSFNGSKVTFQNRAMLRYLKNNPVKMM